MGTKTATEVKNRFGQILEEAMREPIVIQKSGRNVAVLLSYKEYQHLQAIDDMCWAKAADEASKEGFIGTEASEKFLKELLNAKD